MSRVMIDIVISRPMYLRSSRSKLMDQVFRYCTCCSSKFKFPGRFERSVLEMGTWLLPYGFHLGDENGSQCSVLRCSSPRSRSLEDRGHFRDGLCTVPVYSYSVF